MFEKYTEKARRAIFFARYEAGQYGSPLIETEHLLLGLLREDRALTSRLRRAHQSIEDIRRQIEAHTTLHEKAPSSVDTPLSPELKRVLAHAVEDAEGLSHRRVGTGHLLLGLLREEGCFAAQILRERGLRLEEVRETLSQGPEEKEHWTGVKETSLLAEFSRDLTEAARQDQIDPLVGREKELEAVVRILCRRTNSNAVLIGETGVGKAALVKGLARRMAEGNVPPALTAKRLLALHLSALVAGAAQTSRLEERLKAIIRELMEAQDAILFIEELFAPAGRNSLDSANILKPALFGGEIRCISAATPSDHQRSVEKEPWLERCFEVVIVPPPTAAEALRILFGIKYRYEEFHGVTYTDEALQYAVTHSQRYLPDRYLPDKAIDLIDEAGACVKLRQRSLPKEVADSQKRLRFILDRIEKTIATHEFERAQFFTDEERKERETLEQLYRKHNIDELAVATVTRRDIEEVLARWTESPIESENSQEPGP